MKKFFLIFCLIISLNYIMRGEDSDQIRIAVFDPASSGTSIDDGTKIAVREIISSTIVNTGKYSIVERSLLEKIMEEQKFSNSGAVNDLEATEIGKLAGANKVVLSVVTLTGGRNMVSIKIIDVTTATIERQKVKVVTSGELLNVVEPLTLEMLNLKSSSPVSSQDKTGYNDTKINGNHEIQKVNKTQQKEINKNKKIKFNPKPINPNKAFGISIGYVNKQIQTYSAPTIQTGFHWSPEFKNGIGLYTGLFYEYCPEDLGSGHTLSIPLRIQYRYDIIKDLSIIAYIGPSFDLIFGGFFFNPLFGGGVGVRWKSLQLSLGGDCGLINLLPGESEEYYLHKPINISISYLF